MLKYFLNLLPETDLPQYTQRWLDFDDPDPTFKVHMRPSHVK